MRNNQTVSDHRVQPPTRNTRQQINDAGQEFLTHVSRLPSLLPSPRDYAELKTSWTKDLIAGATVGIVALPLALGFGVASGVGAAAGMVTAVVAGIVAAIFGGSHLQVSGPTGAMTVVLLPVIAQHGLGAVPTLAILAGIFVIAMGLTGLGRSVDLIPYSVVEGFTMGIGVIILLQQMPLATGTPAVPSEFSLVSAYKTLAATDWTTAWRPMVVLIGTVIILAAFQTFARKVPAALIAIVITTVIVELTGFEVDRIGQLPAGLPKPSLPDLEWSTITSFGAPALAIAALAALESLLSARVADGMAPTVGRTKPDRELVGQGLANVASGLFGGLPATGAIARTAVNVRSGARTRFSAVVHAVLLLVIILALSKPVSLIPLSALGGILVMTAWKMINFKHAGNIMRTTRADRNTFLLTLACTIVLDLIMAVLLGMAMAAVMSLRHMANYSVVRRERLPADTPAGKVDIPVDAEWLRDDLALFRVDGALFYGDARRFVDEVTSVTDVRAVIIRMHRLKILDASGAVALKDAIDILRRKGIFVLVQGMTAAQLKTSIRVHALTAEDHVDDLTDAIDVVRATLEPKPEYSI